MRYGYIKAAAAAPGLKVADCAYNCRQMIEMTRAAAESMTDVIVFPELCLTGYTCGDLFLQECLLNEAEEQLFRLAIQVKDLNIAVVAGLPFRTNGKLYNCAALVAGGQIYGLVPKTYLPNYAEFYEQRHFCVPPPGCDRRTVNLRGQRTPFDARLLFRFPRAEHGVLAIELCEDLWAPIPPSSYHTQAGATIVANLSAGNEMTGKDDYRRSLVANQSARAICGYVYACAGDGESTTDLVFSGHNIIAENGRILKEAQRFENGVIYADIDVSYLEGERRRNTTFHIQSENYTEIALPEGIGANDTEKFTSANPLDRFIDPAPFVPSDPSARNKRCEEILMMQAMGLKKRISHVGVKKVVLGVSGGLDSTLALLATVRAFDLAKLPRKGIRAITMPCFGTSGRTLANARTLSELAGATFLEIPIADSVMLHFRDILHDSAHHDLTYENAQARERTQVLMDYASRVGGFVIGTGDLSELALGFATYNGDHMSMYGVNASIPKTLIRYLISHVADTCGSGALQNVLLDILNTPVSPELLPPKHGVIAQVTEDILGPYDVHDFFLYYVMRLGFAPDKIFLLAQTAFNGVYKSTQLLDWLKIFYKRFFSNQFKRSCMPDGPKVGSVSLSPRGDWRMPSDASAALWMEILQKITP